MGPSGSGKSTFLEVLAGLRPALGGNASVVDGRGMCLWESTSPARLPIGPSAFVDQHPYIFEGTIRDNLTFGIPSRLSDTVLWQALERTSLYQFTLNRGRAGCMSLSDRGQNLSVGERYRIALCRALLLGRPFLLVDEPFAVSRTRSPIQIVITALMAERDQGTGVVVVTHYLPEGIRSGRTFSISEASYFERLPAPRIAAAGIGFQGKKWLLKRDAPWEWRLLNPSPT